MLTVLACAPAAQAVAPTFATPQTYANATSAEDVAYTDVDGDGIGDLLTAVNDGGGGLRVFFGAGLGAFGTVPDPVATGGLTKRVATADLDGDGVADLVTIDGKTVTVRPGVAGGGFAAATATSLAPDAPAAFAIADLTGDGKPDLAVAGSDGGFPTASGRLWILVNDGSGTFSVDQTIYTGSNRSTSSIVAFDADKDGDQDLAAADFGRQTVQVYKNPGAGVFSDVNGDPTGRTDIALGTTAAAVGAGGDLTGDGNPDLIASAGGDFKVLRGDGAGGFVPDATWYSSGQQNMKIEVVDVNGDGDLDVVTQQKDPGTFEVIAGNGDGTFDTALEIPVGGYLDSILVRDFDGDGKLDLAGADYFGSKLLVVRNTTPMPVAPTVQINTPPLTKATYTKGQSVAADYACTDDAGGLTCTGPVANGQPVDTSHVGTNQRFEVVARDADGLETRVTHFYDVVEAPAPQPAAPTREAAKPAVTPTPPAAKPTPKDQAVVRQSAPVTSAAKSAPKSAPAKPLLTGKPVNLPVLTTVPNVTVIGGYVVASGGGNVIAAGGGNVIAAGGGNVIAAGGGNVIAAGGGNVIAAGGGNLFGGGLRAFAAKAKPKKKLVVLARGSKLFPQPGKGSVKIKATKQGRALLKKLFARRGRQTVRVTYAIGYSEPGMPTVVATKTVTIRE
jgi:hypothetical protein